ncbi:facilitated trehalose transporter Tret1-like isoform X2 [Vanessa atalanta]|uniref:facilitated trehalose transporter Tret1-like isoform X2 n=1 Tax=Vanessa atalanta TaxID=42275 RepID=UPI001FCCF236|nr:facilitated trehalose transporter Tret1-like isoform X2 [Vanessa atalanta]
MSVFRQAYCTLIVCLLTFNIGLMFAWPSSTIKLFSSTNTTLNRPMGETEMALFGSLSSIAALISTPLSGFLIDVLGRKKSCILFALPQPIAWALVSTTPRVDVILASISISGLGGCMFMIAPNFISEFCQETIRGTMTSGAIIFYGIGLMVSYILGGYLSYQIMNYVCLTISVIAVVLIIILKESPTYLMKKGLDEEAAKSIAFYRSTSPNSKLVMQEMDLIRRTLNPKMDDVTPEEENLNPELQTKKKLSVIQFLSKKISIDTSSVDPSFDDILHDHLPGSCRGSSLFRTSFRRSLTEYVGEFGEYFVRIDEHNIWFCFCVFAGLSRKKACVHLFVNSIKYLLCGSRSTNTFTMGSSLVDWGTLICLLYNGYDWSRYCAVCNYR